MQQPCQYKNGDWQCPEQAFNSDTCIIHRPTSKASNELAERIAFRLSAGNKDEDPIRFDGAIFPGGADILKRTYERNISFDEAVFKGNTYFEGAHFKGDVSFSGAKFDNAVFKGTPFTGGKVVFKGAHFTHARFSDAKFDCKEVDFSNAQFRNAVFDDAQINSDNTSFANAKFFGKITFEGTQFKSKNEISFESAEFSKDLELHNPPQGEVIFRGKEPGQVFLEGKVNFKNVKISKDSKVTFEWVNLSQTEFLNTDIQHFKFIDVGWCKGKDFLKLFGGWRSRLYDEYVWRNTSANKNNGKVDDNEYLTQLSYLYRTLKKYYQERGETNLVGHFHCGYMEILLFKEDVENSQNLLSRLKQWISWRRLYKISSRYGEDYGLAAVVLFGLIVIFTPFYALLGVPKKYPSFAEQFLNSLFYSFQAGTFSRLEFYKVEISSWAKFFHLLESILIPAQFAFFAIALRNRFRR